MKENCTDAVAVAVAAAFAAVAAVAAAAAAAVAAGAAAAVAAIQIIIFFSLPGLFLKKKFIRKKRQKTIQEKIKFCDTFDSWTDFSFTSQFSWNIFSIKIPC